MGNDAILPHPYGRRTSTPRTEMEHSLLEFLRIEVRLMRRILSKEQLREVGGFIGVKGFLVNRAVFYDTADLPTGLLPMTRNRCFENCMQMARERTDLVYCEGYALGVIPVVHAWLVDGTGKVIDPTWAGLPHNEFKNNAYFGVPISLAYFDRTAPARAPHATLTVLEDWQNGWPLLTTPPEEYLPL